MSITTEDKILKILDEQGKKLDSLTQGVQDIKQVQAQTNTQLDDQEKKLDDLTKEVREIKHVQSQTNETVNHVTNDTQKLIEGQDQILDEIQLSRAESKADSSHVLKILINHGRSIKALHKGTGISDPNKS
jgi:methyl-accepting chemotaxis protein